MAGQIVINFTGGPTEAAAFLVALGQPNAALVQIQSGIQQLLAGQAQEVKTMAALDDQIATLTSDVAAETTINASAETLIEGFAAQLTAAVAAAQAAGATPTQLASLTALGTSIAANTTGLAAAIAANTPAAPAPAGP